MVTHTHSFMHAYTRACTHAHTQTYTHTVLVCSFPEASAWPCLVSPFTEDSLPLDPEHRSAIQHSFSTVIAPGPPWLYDIAQTVQIRL